jgi:hypothetical protein
MPSYFHQAGEAIGLAVKSWQPANQHNWGNITPSKNWGMNLPTWTLMLQDIVDEFASQIAPKQMKTGTTFDGSRTKELYKLQRRMSDSVV